jgi:hypothetical protein
LADAAETLFGRQSGRAARRTVEQNASTDVERDRNGSAKPHCEPRFVAEKFLFIVKKLRAAR